MSKYIISVMLQRTGDGIVSFTQTQHGRGSDTLSLDEAIGSAVREAMRLKPGYGVVSILWMNTEDFDDCGEALPPVSSEEREAPGTAGVADLRTRPLTDQSQEWTPEHCKTYPRRASEEIAYWRSRAEAAESRNAGVLGTPNDQQNGGA